MDGIENNQIKILLVDDTPVNLEIAGKVLEKEGYNLYITDNGLDAIDLVNETAFDLILLDIMIPEMDGFQICKTIKDNESYKEIPVIFLTAKVDIESIIYGFELGGVDYIRKPFHSLELLARVKTHVELMKMREELKTKNSKLQEAYNQLMILSKTDFLTKLYNRREMLERMEYEKVRHERSKASFCLLMGDIDFFKEVNDTYGHESGDLVLVTISELFINHTRKQDSVGRWGGEEFILLLPETTAAEGAILAEKLRKLVEEKVFSHKDNNFKVTISFGVSDYKSGQTLDILISDADRALYEGKKRGRNCIVIGEGQCFCPFP